MHVRTSPIDEASHTLSQQTSADSDRAVRLSLPAETPRTAAKAAKRAKKDAKEVRRLAEWTLPLVRELR